MYLAIKLAEKSLQTIKLAGRPLLSSVSSLVCLHNCIIHTQKRQTVQNWGVGGEEGEHRVQGGEMLPKLVIG